MEYSNEQLCELIQQAHPELLFTLWKQCERLIQVKAEEYVQQYGRNPELVEDCVQESYIALANIVKNYRSEQGICFSTYLCAALRTTFRAVMLSGRGAAEKDPLNNCESLDRIIEDAEGNETELIDTLPDEYSEEGFLDIENEDYRKSQNAFLRECISLASDETGKAILNEMLRSNCNYRDAILNLYGSEALTDEEVVIGLRKQKDHAVAQIRKRTQNGKEELLRRKHDLVEAAESYGLRTYTKGSYDRFKFTSGVELAVLKLNREK